MIRKVPLKQFVNLLIRIYEDGYDYVDLHHTSGEDRDAIAIHVVSAYLHEEGDQEEEYDVEERSDEEPDINYDDLLGLN